MIKTLFKALALTSLILLVTQESQAARRDNRQGRQRARIHQGVKSGELTKGEAHRLRKQQRHINRMENRAEADGNVTAVEKMRIEKAQDRASKNIYRKKHNEADRNDNTSDPSATAETSNTP